MSTLEDILLWQDRRGMTALRSHLPPEYCQRAAQLLLYNPGCVLICTGFFVSRIAAPETDGPPGALALGRAVTALGGRAVYVSDYHTTPLLEHFGGGAHVLDFPITTAEDSQKFAQSVLERYQPSLLVSIERCGVTARGRYLNSRGVDISAQTARLDTLFAAPVRSIGIGDGGNEIGMGKLAQIIPGVPGLPAEPAVTATTELVVASVSNWGAYGILAALSALAGRNLLPDPAAEEDLLRALFDRGCYDGTRGEPVCGVDGFTPAENSALLHRLHSWLYERCQIR